MSISNRANSRFVVKEGVLRKGFLYLKQYAGLRSHIIKRFFRLNEEDKEEDVINQLPIFSNLQWMSILREKLSTFFRYAEFSTISFTMTEETKRASCTSSTTRFKAVVEM